MCYRIVQTIIAALLAAWCSSFAAAQSISEVMSLTTNSSATTRATASRHLNSPTGMSVDEAVRYALANNKNLLADRKTIDEALGKLKQAGARANPMLETSGLSSVNDSGMRSASVMLSLPLEPGGRRARRIDVAQREVERMRFEVADRERMLAADVRMKYGEAVEMARNLELSERLLELNQQSVTLVKARVDNGASAPVEQSLLRVEVSRLETQRISYESKLNVLLEELKSLLGMPEAESLQLRDEFNETSVRLTREVALEQALATRPDLQAARAAETLADAMIEMAKAEGRYDLSFFTEFGLQRLRFDQFGVNHEGSPERVAMTSLMARSGVTITLPTRNKNQGNIEAAIAARDAARLRREFITSVIRREIAAAFARHTGAQRVLKTYDTELLAASQNNLRVVRGSYDLGYAKLNDVLEEQRRLLEVQMGYNESLKEAFAARTQLETALGASLRDK